MNENGKERLHFTGDLGVAELLGGLDDAFYELALVETHTTNSGAITFVTATEPDYMSVNVLIAFDSDVLEVEFRRLVKEFYMGRRIYRRLLKHDPYPSEADEVARLGFLCMPSTDSLDGGINARLDVYHHMDLVSKIIRKDLMMYFYGERNVWLNQDSIQASVDWMTQ